MAESAPPRPPHEIAYEELERIESLSFLEQGLIKKHYTEISEVIRRYIGHRFGIITMELTTGELIDSLADEELDGSMISTIRVFLEECDLVKFAKFIPGEDQTSTSLPRARSIVDETKETLLFSNESEEADEPDEENISGELEPVGERSEQ